MTAVYVVLLTCSILPFPWNIAISFVDRYDLALLQLSIAAGRMFHISPVCLPQPGIRLQGRSGVVAGWGKIKPSTELTGTNVLRSATVPILGK